jgi:hypothetical protein
MVEFLLDILAWTWVGAIAAVFAGSALDAWLHDPRTPAERSRRAL